MIKKYFYLVMVALVATLPLSLASCGSDDDDHDGGINSDIVGTWKGFSVSGWGVDDEDGEVYTQFKKDGTYVEASYYEDDDGYTVSTGTWYQKGDYLYLTTSVDLGILDDDDTDDDMTFPFHIVSVDGKTMSLEFLGYIITAVKVADAEMQEFMKKHEGAPQPNGGQLSVDGTIWEASIENRPHFTDSYLGFLLQFERKETYWVFERDDIEFNVQPKFLGNGKYVKIKEGMDITNKDNFTWLNEDNGSCCYVLRRENMMQLNNKNKPWVSGTYTQIISGHAYIKKYETEKSITIQFDNLKLRLEEGYDMSYFEDEYQITSPKTITLNGTVTYVCK